MWRRRSIYPRSNDVAHNGNPSSEKTRKQSRIQPHVQWNIMAIAAFSLAGVATALTAAALASENWEVVSYKRDKLLLLANASGYELLEKETYYLLQPAFPNNLSNQTYAICMTMIAGLWSSCDTVNDTIRTETSDQGVSWLTASCVVHSSIGRSDFDPRTAEYRRLELTRLAQSTMISSLICLLSIAIVGFVGYFFAQALACIMAACLCFAGALYQVYTGMIIWLRMLELPYARTTLGNQYQSKGIQEGTIGASITYIAFSGPCMAVAGILWVFACQLIRQERKSLEF